MSDPFTLRIFVPSGDPEGVRIVDRMNWTGKGYFLPRDRWSDIKARPELARPGVYVLIGHETDALGAERPVVYIGQSEDVQSRINQHDLGKEFWDRAAIFTSTSGGLNRAHTTWLEWELIQRAASVKRCRLENVVSHTEPNLLENEKADTRGFLNEILRWMPIMGISVFEKARLPTKAALKAAGLEPEPQDRTDTIIVPAQREGFDEVFLGQNAWWAIRIAEKHRAGLKWIAAYQSAPVSAITHIAEIERLEPYGDAGKFKVVFKGPATKLKKPIPLAGAPPGSMQGPRYTTHAALLEALSVKELMK